MSTQADGVTGGGAAAEPAPTPAADELASRIRQLEQENSDLRDQVEDLLMSGHPGAGGNDGADAADTDADADAEVWETYYDSLVEFVEERFAAGFARAVPGQLRWCSQWWAHTEAVSRLESLWRTWEAARLEPVEGMANWYAARLDHHLPILLSGTGPFQQCTPDRHTAIAPLPTAPVPDEFFTAAAYPDPASLED